MGFKVGTVVTVDNAIKMMMVKSANDMAVVLAEGVGGFSRRLRGDDERQCPAPRHGAVELRQPERPARRSARSMSARDLAILARALIHDFPEYDDYWHLHGIRFGKRVIAQLQQVAGSLSGRRRHEDRLHLRVRLQSRRHRDAQRPPADRRRAGRRRPPACARYHAAQPARGRLQPAGPGSTAHRLRLQPSTSWSRSRAPAPTCTSRRCGADRKRPAAEDEEVSVSDDGEDGNSPLASVLQACARPIQAKASDLLGQQVSALPPVDVFVGTVSRDRGRGRRAGSPDRWGRRGKRQEGQAGQEAEGERRRPFGRRDTRHAAPAAAPTVKTATSRSPRRPPPRNRGIGCHRDRTEKFRQRAGEATSRQNRHPQHAPPRQRASRPALRLAAPRLVLRTTPINSFRGHTSSPKRCVATQTPLPPAGDVERSACTIAHNTCASGAAVRCSANHAADSTIQG